MSSLIKKLSVFSENTLIYAKINVFLKVFVLKWMGYILPVDAYFK